VQLLLFMVFLFGSVNMLNEQLTMMFLIITSSLIGKDEYFAATIPGLIHKIKLSLSTVDDGELNEVLETFSLQVLHEKILFSAGGFYPINMKIITMVSERVHIKV
jgi:7tm Chemosensory receptor